MTSTTKSIPTNDEKHAAKLQALSTQTADHRALMRATLQHIDTGAATSSAERRMLLQSSESQNASSPSQSLAGRVRIFAPLAVVALVVLGGVMVLRKPAQSPNTSTGTSLTASQVEPNGTTENTINATSAEVQDESAVTEQEFADGTSAVQESSNNAKSLGDISNDTSF